MMYRSALLGSLVLVAVTACQDSPTAPAALAPTPTVVASRQAAAARPALDRSRITLPAFGAIADRPLVDLARRAIDPADYSCSTQSSLNAWIEGAIARSLDVEASSFLTAYNYLADLIPTYDALFFQSADKPQRFGTRGEHTRTIDRTERDLKRFWDVPSDDIQVVAMHGSVLVDTLRTAATYRLLGYTTAEAATSARLLRGVLMSSRTMVGGSHPFFTFNAVAATWNGKGHPDKIAIGDGLLAAYDALGLDDVAPQAILAHEFAHHVQFEKAISIVGTPAEMSRFAELNADALAAYYLTHKRGEGMKRKRVEQFLQVFFQIGDCSFASDAHHGTPNQRLAAARFGFTLADEAQRQGRIMPSARLHAAFMDEYPKLIAPDAR
ncbi:MAG: hypothetical protein ACXW05_17465 [Gemmatirosa sp.]